MPSPILENQMASDKFLTFQLPLSGVLDTGSGISDPRILMDSCTIAGEDLSKNLKSRPGGEEANSEPTDYAASILELTIHKTTMRSDNLKLLVCFDTMESKDILHEVLSQIVSKAKIDDTTIKLSGLIKEQENKSTTDEPEWSFIIDDSQDLIFKIRDRFSFNIEMLDEEGTKTENFLAIIDLNNIKVNTDDNDITIQKGIDRKHSFRINMS